MIYHECDERAHIEDSLRNGDGELSTPTNGLSQQTIVMLDGREINRAIRNVTGRTWQQGTISVNGVDIDVYRDAEQEIIWHEMKKVESVG
jgi:hypothetical protein